MTVFIILFPSVRFLSPYLWNKTDLPKFPPWGGVRLDVTWQGGVSMPCCLTHPCPLPTGRQALKKETGPQTLPSIASNIDFILRSASALVIPL